VSHYKHRDEWQLWIIERSWSHLKPRFHSLPTPQRIQHWLETQSQTLKQEALTDISSNIWYMKAKGPFQARIEKEKLTETGGTLASLTSRTRSTNGILSAMAREAAAMWGSYQPPPLFFLAACFTASPTRLAKVAVAILAGKFKKWLERYLTLEFS
jgi:hypothetical protein